ncbi:arylsulfatase [Halosquirtibacter xylanolyticus]|uniref:sulfatase family protein n=1 Tax=Halosquirtibacter xylanolyticus TaxID=3374599 RepID=UPI0037481212|nr:arylsulfatase [Prolixibacteraceae bacterium]
MNTKDMRVKSSHALKLFSATLLIPFLQSFSSTSNKPQDRPNIVIIYADDMGYGDLNCQNPNSKIPTKNLDRLASEGIRFTDAHSSSGICSPSRYALLTGQYHWRRTHRISNSFDKPMFRDSDITLPQVLKDGGYATACIGKWHMGWNWNLNNEPSGRVKHGRKVRKAYMPKDVDWSKPVSGGPTSRGFDYYFGDGTINFPPYTWFENDKPVEVPTEMMNIKDTEFKTKEGGWEFRPGPKTKDWDPYKVLPTLCTKSTEWIAKQSKKKPFFLYLALPSPHAPIIPNDEFDGTSQAGAYGDFMVQTDWVAGQVMKALKDNGFDQNTIVIFSADNGPERYAFKRAEKYDHYSMGDFRGLKRDVWEGGHHIPFIVKWPNNVKAGAVSNELISQIDIMSTVTAAANIDMPKSAAPDSKNILPILKGEQTDQPVHEVLVHNTKKGHWGLRKGNWLYINSSTGSVSKMPKSYMKLKNYTTFETEGLLFDIEKDPEQRTNLYAENPEVVKEMSTLLQKELDEKYAVDY